MAKQTGIIPLRGTIGNITFVQTQDGDLAKKKSNLTKERVKNDPAFQRTRENATEFATATMGAGTLRDVFLLPVANCFDNRLQSRLLTRAMRVVKSDMVSDRGLRNMVSGNPVLLQGFSWNRNVSLVRVMQAPYSLTVDRVAGTITVSIPSFLPLEQLAGNPDATHYKIITSAAEIDWTIENDPADMISSAYLPYDNTPTIAINNVHSLSAGTTLPLFTTISIRWFQQVSGGYYPLKNLKFDTASIVNVNA